MRHSIPFAIQLRNDMLENGSETLSLEAMFWRWLCLFSFRRWKTAFRGHPIGVPGERDPRFPCTSYMPRERHDHNAPHCHFPDWHYLCGTCASNATIPSPIAMHSPNGKIRPEVTTDSPLATPISEAR